jgi:hypothetical protein
VKPPHLAAAVVAAAALIGGGVAYAASTTTTMNAGDSLNVGCHGASLSWTQTDATDATLTCAAPSIYRVNTGGQYVDSAGNTWTAPQGFSPATTYATSGPIAGTADAPLYQTELYAKTFQFSAAVPNGSYTVTLNEAENYWTTVGQRVFNVAINGTTVLSNFDILAHTSPNTALQESFPVAVTSGAVTVTFTTTTDNAKIDSLSITPGGGTTTTTTQPPQTTTTVAPTTTTVAPTTTTQPPPPLPAGTLPALTVNDSKGQLLAGGKPVILRGADASGTETACAQNWTTDPYGGQPFGSVATFQAMAAWGINVVRIPLNEDCWLGINGVEVGGAVYQQGIATEVAAAHAAGLYAILDLHWSAPGTQRALSQNPAPDQDHSVVFWQQVAAAFRADRGVIFDLYNEPYDYWGVGDAWTGWLNGTTQTQYVTGGSPYTVTANWQTAGMQQLVNTVRAAGATQPILVNGLDWANDDSGWLAHVPADPARQLIAGAHIYPGESCATSSCWSGVFPAIRAAGYPILIGETGDASTTTSDPGQSNWLANNFFGYADSQGWSYLAWTWNVWSNADDVLITGWNGTPTSGEGTEWKTHLAG